MRWLKSNVFVPLVMIAMFLGSVICWASYTNGRNDTITIIHSDRGGGVDVVSNGRGEQATVFMPWYPSLTTVNGRGETLEIDGTGFVPRSRAMDWEAYDRRDNLMNRRP